MMKKMYKMENQVQKYEWGTKDFISSLLGLKKQDDSPWAELWMGAHSKAPSFLPYLNLTLDKAIKLNPQAFLSKEVADKYNNNLPYLFKVLSSRKPLSIQAHPNLEQAKAGYQKENDLGIDLSDFTRNYKDDNHKPELICALTEFHAMCGFRPAEEIVELFSDLGLTTIFENFASFQNKQDSESWSVLFKEILNASVEKKQQCLEHTIKNIHLLKDKYTKDWLAKLFDIYPNDIGAISPLFLNTFKLEPGQAVYLQAGFLHAYLQGTGIEIMANSDNVLRGGLTPKNIDVAELTSILQWKMEKAKIQTYPPKENLIEYKIASQEFSLKRLNLQGEYKLLNSRPTIILIISGQVEVKCNGETKEINQGQSIFITAQAEEIKLKGQALLFIASTNN